MSVSAPHDANPSAQPGGEQGNNVPTTPTPERGMISRRNLLLGLGGGAVGGILGTSAIIEAVSRSKTNIPEPRPKPSHEVTPPQTREWWHPEGDPLSPENLAKLGTAKEIRKTSTVYKGALTTLEAFGRYDAYRLNAFYMSGSTEDEWRPFNGDSPVGAFAEAQAKRYNPPMESAMFIDGLDVSPVEKLKEGILTGRVEPQYRVISSGESTVPFKLHRQFTELIGHTGSIESGSFGITYLMEIKDNLDETGLNKTSPDMNSLSGITQRRSEWELIDDEWKIVDFEDTKQK